MTNPPVEQGNDSAPASPHITPAAPRCSMEAAMDDILALYEWTPGSCFRCARTGLDTTHIKTVRPRSGPAREVRACRDCVLELEEVRRRDAERHGVEYVPGHVGNGDG